jgi:hypothetical protein
LPTIQAYRRTDLIGNLVRVTNDLSDEFDEDDVVNLLKEWVIKNVFFPMFCRYFSLKIVRIRSDAACCPKQR